MLPCLGFWTKWAWTQPQLVYILNISPWRGISNEVLIYQLNRFDIRCLFSVWLTFTKVYRLYIPRLSTWAASLLYMMDKKLRQEPAKLETFKSEAKKWVKGNIQQKSSRNPSPRDQVPRVGSTANQTQILLFSPSKTTNNTNRHWVQIMSSQYWRIRKWASVLH